jgi:hypothetical protein
MFVKKLVLKSYRSITHLNVRSNSFSQSRSVRNFASFPQRKFVKYLNQINNR